VLRLGLIPVSVLLLCLRLVTAMLRVLRQRRNRRGAAERQGEHQRSCGNSHCPSRGGMTKSQEYKPPDALGRERTQTELPECCPPVCSSPRDDFPLPIPVPSITNNEEKR